jgi:hypothetical protein
MSDKHSKIGTVGHYVALAGKSCCCGRSWVGLNASLARRGDAVGEGPCDEPLDETVVGEREADEPTFVSSTQL